MSYRATQRRPNTSAPSDGSRTITLTGAPPNEADDSGEGSSNEPPTVGTLKLRGATRKTRQRVVWSDDVVDNEGCGRKSSKICCIYHKPKPFDESSSEEDSDSDSDDSSCAGRHNHSHSHRQRRSSGGSGGEGLQNRETGSSVVQLESDDSDKNAYEIAPSSKKGKRKAGGA